MTDQSPLAAFEQEEQKVRSDFNHTLQALGQSFDTRVVENLKVQFLGKKGSVTKLMEQLRNVDKDMRPAAGKVVNELRQWLDAQLSELKQKAETFELQQSLASKKLDISLPTTHMRQSGSLHPVTLMRRLLLKEFRKLGFAVWDGPEVDLEFYNFSALNFKDDHPARDMQDTFFIEGKEQTVLRTHTSNIQIHAMLNLKPPMRVVAPGRTFRCDSDPTHTPMFHQIEGFVVDQNISMADMKGIIDTFLRAIYGSHLATRLRPSFFPFVEPGGEVDLQCVRCSGAGCRLCKQTGWLEIGGLGMIHPNVFEAVDLNSENYTGFAFGFGIDRMAMLKFGLDDLRTLFEGNRQFLSQFPIHL